MPTHSARHANLLEKRSELNYAPVIFLMLWISLLAGYSRSVTSYDAEGGRTGYEYDSRGLQTLQRDALGVKSQII